MHKYLQLNIKQNKNKCPLNFNYHFEIRQQMAWSNDEQNNGRPKAVSKDTCLPINEINKQYTVTQCTVDNALAL